MKSGFYRTTVCVTAGMFAAMGLGYSRAGAAEGPGLQVLSYSTVFAYPETDPYNPFNRYGFNHAPSVVTLPDGRLLCVWFSGPYEAAVSQVILGAVSNDGGYSWEKAQVLQDFPRRSDFDPALIADGARTWLFFTAGRWNRYPFIKSEGDAVGQKSYHLYYRYSDDSARTWSEPVEVSQGDFCRTNGIKLSTGELLLPVYRQDDPSAGVLKSSDGGKTWVPTQQVKCEAGTAEPTIAELKSGDVLMALRTGDGYLWTTLSTDKGETWAEPTKTDIEAAATSHNLLHISDGRVVLTHDENARYRTPLTMRITEDGKTWSEPLLVAECPIPEEGDPVWNRQVTYPSVTETADNTLVVVWSDITMADYPDRSEQYGIIRSARVKVLD